MKLREYLINDNVFWFEMYLIRVDKSFDVGNNKLL